MVCHYLFRHFLWCYGADILSSRKLSILHQFTNHNDRRMYEQSPQNTCSWPCGVVIVKKAIYRAPSRRRVEASESVRTRMRSSIFMWRCVRIFQFVNDNVRSSYTNSVNFMFTKNTLLCLSILNAFQHFTRHIYSGCCENLNYT